MGLNRKVPVINRWENYILQFPKLKEHWDMITEPHRTLFKIQINVYAQHFQDTINEYEEHVDKLKENNKLLIDGLAKECVARKEKEDQVNKLYFMIENGLDFEDLKRDI